MKMKNIYLLFAIVLLFACEPVIDDFTTESGGADFTKYVAIGNSLTAGFADKDLYKSGQENSYPAILAYQFEAAGGGEFKQPLMFDEYGFGNRLVLDASIPGPVPAQGTPSNQNFVNIAGDGPFNNMGVPGAKSFHLVPGAEAFSALNPYYRRFAAEPGLSTVLAEAIEQDPTFFSLWIGNNDILGYATSGGAGDWITNSDTVAGVINSILQALTISSAKGVIANIPDIMSAPYFTFMSTQVPYNGLVLTEQAQVDALDAAYQPLGITFSLGQNPFIVEDAVSHLPRKMELSDIFLLSLPTDSILNYGMGSVIPIPHKYILDEDETDNVNNAVNLYNQIIQALAIQYDIAHVDINSVMNEVASTGLEIDGINFTADFITGKTFSLDGIHLTAQAYAVVANYFIEAINAKYVSHITTVSPRLYPGIYYL